MATELGLPLSTFWSIPDTDRAYMIAYQRVKGLMQAFDHHLATKKPGARNLELQQHG